MPRSIWSGAISFGLVNVPVKLYSAVSKKTVRFHQLDSKDNSRIQQKRVNPNTGEVESLEVLFFSTRLLRSELFELPVRAELHLAGTGGA